VGADVAGVAGADERELLRLSTDGVDHGLVLVPEVRADELRGQIQVALPRGVPEVDALRAGDVDRLPPPLGAPGTIRVSRSQIADVFCHGAHLIGFRGKAPGVNCAKTKDAG